MCNVLEWMSSVRVCVYLSIYVMVVEVEGGRSNTDNNCLANVLDGFSSQPFLAFPSISLHDVRRKKRKGEKRGTETLLTKQEQEQGARTRKEGKRNEKISRQGGIP